MTRRIDCKGDGCEVCQMCRYLNFLEWAGQVSGGIPSVIKRNPKLDAILAAEASMTCTGAMISGGMV